MNLCDVTDKFAKAVIFATAYHNDQRDKSGEPYIFHCMAVAMQLKKEKERIVAVLHDVLEDTEATFQDIKDEFGMEIAEAVYMLTKQSTESYEEYLEGLKENPLSLAVKKADIYDNLLVTRIHNLDKETKQRLITKYEKAKKILYGA